MNLAKIHDKIKSEVTDKLISVHEDGAMDFEVDVSDDIKSKCKDIFDNYIDAKSYTPLQFMALFSNSEQDKIIQSNDASIKLFLLYLSSALDIKTDDIRTLNGMDYLVSIGILTEERKVEILS